MPMRFLMVPGSENHYFDEFLTFYFKKVRKFRFSFQNIQNKFVRPHVQNDSKKLPAMLKIVFSIFFQKKHIFMFLI